MQWTILANCLAGPLKGKSIELRLLCSSRDPGSALSMAPVIAQFQKIKNVTVKILAQNPAYKIFMSDPRLRNEYIVEVEDVDPTLLPEMVFSAVKNFDLTVSCAGSLVREMGLMSVYLKQHMMLAFDALPSKTIGAT